MIQFLNIANVERVCKKARNKLEHDIKKCARKVNKLRRKLTHYSVLNNQDMYVSIYNNYVELNNQLKTYNADLCAFNERLLLIDELGSIMLDYYNKTDDTDIRYDLSIVNEEDVVLRLECVDSDYKKLGFGVSLISLDEYKQLHCQSWKDTNSTGFNYDYSFDYKHTKLELVKRLTGITQSYNYFMQREDKGNA